MGDQHEVVVAVYSIIPNGTIQFIFVDTHYGEIGFNNYFIEANKHHFPSAYSYYETTFKPQLSRRDSDTVNQMPQAINNEELSSDDEHELVLEKPTTPSELQSTITDLLDSGLRFYEIRINKR